MASELHITSAASPCKSVLTEFLPSRLKPSTTEFINSLVAAQQNFKEHFFEEVVQSFSVSLKTLAC